MEIYPASCFLLISALYTIKVATSVEIPFSMESDTCCVRQQMSISTQKNVPVANGNLLYVSVLEKTNSTSGLACDSKVLLKATFQKYNGTDVYQGCTDVPKCANRLLRIDLMMSSNKTGFSFHVGDSRTNNGYRGDAATQTNDAEFHFVGYGHLLYASDKCPTFSQIQTGLLGTCINWITVYVGNEFIRVTNNIDYTYELCSNCLFALNGQPEQEGTVNEDIYIGLNRIISSPDYRTGTGVCDAVISWACPWN